MHLFCTDRERCRFRCHLLQYISFYTAVGAFPHRIRYVMDVMTVQGIILTSAVPLIVAAYSSVYVCAMVDTMSRMYPGQNAARIMPCTRNVRQ